MNILVHPTTYIVTAWLAPCVPSRPSIRILLKIGLLSASGLTVLLLTLVPMADQVGDTLEDYPSIFHCLETLPESAGKNKSRLPLLFKILFIFKIPLFSYSRRRNREARSGRVGIFCMSPL